MNKKHSAASRAACASALSSFVLALAIAGCNSPEDDTSTDAGNLVGADGASETDAEPPSALIVTVGGDYAGNGILTTLSVPDMELTVNAVAGVAGGDPTLRAIGDRLFILDRFGGDSITVLSRELGLIGQVSTGTGSNPQDLTVIGDTLYVAAWDSTGVLVIDLNDIDGGVVKTIDLSALDTGDGVPDCNSIYAVGTRLFVSCQLMDRSTYSPRGNGKVAVIDTTNDSLETTLNLNATNPFAQFEALPNGELLFSTAPGAIFGATNESGCVERIATAGEPSMMDCLSQNSQRNAYASDILVVDDAVYFINVASYTEADIWKVEGNNTRAAGLTVGTNVTAISGCPTGHMVVADNTDGARGLRVFQADGTPLQAEAVDPGWPASFLPSNGTICW